MDDGCDACGFGYDMDAPIDDCWRGIEAGAAAAAELIANAADPAVRHDPDEWSAIEYASHLRDVLFVQRERVLHALREDGPLVVPMGRDVRVEQEGYAAQDPADVAVQLTHAAKLFANVLARLEPAAWQRTLLYNFPEPEQRPIHWLAVHTQHEVVHHLNDVRRQLSA